jgi:hypothetical protein
MISGNGDFLLNSIKSIGCTKDIGWQGVFSGFV